MKCKECEYFNYTGGNRKIDGSCKHPDIPFPMVSRNNECLFTRSKLHCKDCKHWSEAEGMNREDDCGGCTYGGGFFPMFLNETCGLIDPYKTEVEKEMLSDY